MLSAKLIEHLNYYDVRYITIRHSPAYSAQEIAEVAHIPGQEMAKTVMVKIDGLLAMIVLPASRSVDFASLYHQLGTEQIDLACEEDFSERFPDCEIGAMPPFGNLYAMDTYVCSSLAQDKEIVFNAGAHDELIRMSYDDYERIAEPRALKM